jgi:hypothetical protein
VRCSPFGGGVFGGGGGLNEGLLGAFDGVFLRDWESENCGTVKKDMVLGCLRK